MYLEKLPTNEHPEEAERPFITRETHSEDLSLNQNISRQESSYLDYVMIYLHPREGGLVECNIIR